MKRIALVFAAASLLLAISCLKPEELTTSASEDVLPSSSSFDDSDALVDSRDNQSYPTVIIDGKKWMAKNLNYAGLDGELGMELSEGSDIYGRLYSWKETNMMQACTRMFCQDGTNDCNTCVGGFCPQGWHLPSKEEWEGLIAFAGGEEVAEKKLKASTSWRWYYYNEQDAGGTDDYGFSALAAGKSPTRPPFSCPVHECPPPPECKSECDEETGLCSICPIYDCPLIVCTAPAADGNFGETAWWWSSTEIDADNAYSISIGSRYNMDNVAIRNYKKSYKMSVRCVEN